ncbi:hypothetical protein T02_978, partial [Trichinella nativa]
LMAWLPIKNISTTKVRYSSVKLHAGDENGKAYFFKIANQFA